MTESDNGDRYANSPDTVIELVSGLFTNLPFRRFRRLSCDADDACAS